MTTEITTENAQTVVFKGTYNGCTTRPTWHNLEEGRDYPSLMTPTQCRVINSMLRGSGQFLLHMGLDDEFTVEVNAHKGFTSVYVKLNECTVNSIILKSYSRHFFVGPRGKITKV